MFVTVLEKPCKKVFASIAKVAFSMDGNCQKWVIDNLGGVRPVGPLRIFDCLIGNYSFINYTAPSFGYFEKNTIYLTIFLFPS